MNMLHRAFWLPLILFAFVVLGVIYSVATPVFEASDEVSHYAVVQYIADTGSLPVQQPGIKTPWDQEGSQPPLYYLLVSPLARIIDTHDAAERMYRNPHAAPGDPSLDANRNLVIHTLAENFPWRNTSLVVHLIRFISIVMSAGTIVLSYLIARRIFPDPRTRSIPIGTAALSAFNPMFLFISASVNNDNLTILLTSLVLYLSVLCWYEPAGRIDRSGWGRRLLLGVVLGGAALSKISGLTLLPIVALILTVRHLHRRDWRGWIVSGLLMALPVLIIAGWWYARNLQLYGEWLGLNTMVAIAGPRSLSLIDLVPEFGGFRYSYWALFGAVNIVTFPLAYVIFDLFTLISVVGGVIWFVRRRHSDPFVLLLILVAYVLIVFAGVVRWTMMTPASQGRLLFPAIAAISLLLWLGWETIFNDQLPIFNFRTRHPISTRSVQLLASHWSKLRWSMPLFMLLVAVVVPFRDLAPTYAGPQIISQQQLPSDLKRLDVDYGDQLQLVGYRLAGPLARVDSVEFTLYWQCLKPMLTDYSVFAIVYGHQLQELGKRDAYPYHGLFATSQCPSGQYFADPYKIPIATSGLAQSTVLRTQIGLRDGQTSAELEPMAAGKPLSAVMLDVGKFVAMGSVPLQGTVDYRLGDDIRLLSAQIVRQNGAPYLSSMWTTSATPQEGYTIFVHILDASGKMIGQADGPPLGGDYPTDWWSSGETIVDTRPLPLPPEADRVTIGLYRLSDQTRLPVIDQSGQRVPNDEIVLPVKF